MSDLASEYFGRVLDGLLAQVSWLFVTALNLLCLLTAFGLSIVLTLTFNFS